MYLKVIINPLMLKEQGLIAPERGSNLTCKDDSTDQFTARSRELMEWRLVGENFPEDRALGDRTQLIRKVSLPRVCPSIDVVGLEFQNERPLRVFLLYSALRILAPIFHTHRTNVVRCFSQLFSNCLTCALV